MAFSPRMHIYIQTCLRVSALVRGLVAMEMPLDGTACTARAVLCPMVKPVQRLIFSIKLSDIS